MRGEFREFTNQPSYVLFWKQHTKLLWPLELWWDFTASDSETSVIKAGKNKSKQ